MAPSPVDCVRDAQVAVKSANQEIFGGVSHPKRRDEIDKRGPIKTFIDFGAFELYLQILDAGLVNFVFTKWLLAQITQYLP